MVDDPDRFSLGYKNVHEISKHAILFAGDYTWGNSLLQNRTLASHLT